MCCPFGSSPDPKNCKWRSDKTGFWCGNPLAPLLGQSEYKCEGSEKKVLSSDWFIDDQGRDDVCHQGTSADYCCETERDAVCKWTGKCTQAGEDRSKDCPKGMESFDGGFARNGCPANSWEVLCCEAVVEPDCRWVGDPYKHCEAKCDHDEIGFGRHDYGGGKQCLDEQYIHQFWQFGYPDDEGHGNVLCCTIESVRVKTKNLPVPLENLFDEKIGDDETQEFDIDVDIDNSRENSHPNANSFGWHIMSGPPDQVENLSKRDGSHWEVYGCDTEKHEGRQSARLVCTKDRSSAHNCDNILKGGVVDTVLEMPSHCGVGKYALAISLEPMHDASTDDTIHPRLMKRLPVGTTVYNLTFDYGFHRLQGRADNKVKIRIDYSNVKNYWNKIVGPSISIPSLPLSPSPPLPLLT